MPGQSIFYSFRLCIIRSFLFSLVLCRICAENNSPKGPQAIDNGELEIGIMQSCFTICPCLRTDLHIAAEKGRLWLVRLLVEQGADKDKVNSNGLTPLYLASCHGHLDVVQYLVEQGSELDKANNYGYTPLSIATAFGHHQIARYLLEQGADKEKAGHVGDPSTPLLAQVIWR